MTQSTTSSEAPVSTTAGASGLPALAYAARGWHVFPLIRDDKRPAIKAWEQHATTDPDRITRAWAPGGNYTGCGIGIATGPSNLVVVDLDTRKNNDDTPPPEWDEPGVVDGSDVLAALYERHGDGEFPIGRTPTVRTCSGGLHLYFTAPAERHVRNSAGRIGWKIDVRAGGGYVVAPPSSAGGRLYHWEAGQDELSAVLPPWLLDLAAPVAVAPPVAPELDAANRWLMSGNTARSAPPERILVGLVDVVLQARPGTRNDCLNWAAYRAFEHARDGQLDARQAADALRVAALRVGPDEQKIMSTIRSAHRAVFGAVAA